MIFNINELSLQEQVLFSTVRIKTDKGSGTGFFFRFEINGNTVPVVATNKHVVEGAKTYTLYFTKLINNSQIKTSEREVLTGEIENSVIMHPNEDIDLCIIPIGGFLRSTSDIFFIPIDESLIPNQEKLKELKAIEDIVMVGYPIGLMDERNNMPLVRKGITATHPFLDYDGKSEFVIDAACFPGSSGSPIFLNDFGSYIDKYGNTIISMGKPYLLGILYAGPLHTINGEIKIQTILTEPRIYSEIQTMINLGYVIKSSALLEFKQLIKQKL